MAKKITWVNAYVAKKDEVSIINDLSVAHTVIRTRGMYSMKVRNAAKEYGYTNIAHQLGRSVEAVHKWFRLSRIPEPMIPHVADMLGLRVDDFVRTGEDNGKK